MSKLWRNEQKLSKCFKGNRWVEYLSYKIKKLLKLLRFTRLKCSFEWGTWCKIEWNKKITKLQIMCRISQATLKNVRRNRILIRSYRRVLRL